MSTEHEILKVDTIKPMFNNKRLAEFFGVQTKDGKPCTQMINQWVREGKIPPPDVRLTSKTPLWKHDTIMSFVEMGGYKT